jgi:hypothetical protein
MTYTNDLELLEDILDTLAFEDEPTILSEEYAIELLDPFLPRDGVSFDG